MKIKVMRGIPGSGKSTIANELYTNGLDSVGAGAIIVSADHYFMKDGAYIYNSVLISEAHKSCMRSFLTHINHGTRLIIVDNTNINVEDMAPYIAVGEAMGYDVEIVQVNTDPEVAAARNVHGVPKGQVLNMHSRLQTIRLPTRWKVSRAAV